MGLTKAGLLKNAELAKEEYQKSVKKEDNDLNKINEYSFGIYLFHQQIIYILTFYMFGRLNVALEIFLTFAISIILAYIIQKILKKNKITKFIFGI